jgi:hypothetical protein
VLFFMALSCLAAATFGSVVLYQRGERRRLEAGGGVDPRLLLPERRTEPPTAVSTPPARSGEPTLDHLQQGDIVDDGENDWVVTGSARYREERETWWLHALDGGARQRFLEVRRRGDELEVAFVDRAVGLPSGQLLQGLTFSGQAFQLDVRGDARVVVDGVVDGMASGTVAYARYGGPGGALLLVEDEGAARRAFAGSRVPVSSLSFMSGELNRSS